MYMYTGKNFEHILTLPNFSQVMMKNHITLYEGYVKNVNLIDDKLKEFAGNGKIGAPEYNELKRRYAWEYNGMVLHELYFENMILDGGHIAESSDLYSTLVGQYGSLDSWKNDFIATGAMRGIGWVVLVKEINGDLKNVWLNEHDLGIPVGSKPLLVMDVFEHSYMLDFGLNRADYINAFFNVIDFKIVGERMK